MPLLPAEAGADERWTISPEIGKSPGEDHDMTRRHAQGSGQQPGRQRGRQGARNGPWLNQVERFFTLLTERQLRRRIHRSVADLQTTITGFIEQHNAALKPFRRTKSAPDILASIERFCIRNLPAQA